MHELIRILRESPVEIETHIENPQESAIFSQYPRIQASSAVYQVEEMLDKQLDAMKEESLHGSHALQNMADALPALGIVAAVLGVIKTMASIDKPPEILGGMIGGGAFFLLTDP